MTDLQSKISPCTLLRIIEAAIASIVEIEESTRQIHLMSLRMTDVFINVQTPFHLLMTHLLEICVYATAKAVCHDLGRRHATWRLTDAHEFSSPEQVLAVQES